MYNLLKKLTIYRNRTVMKKTSNKRSREEAESFLFRDYAT